MENADRYGLYAAFKFNAGANEFASMKSVRVGLSGITAAVNDLGKTTKKTNISALAPELQQVGRSASASGKAIAAQAQQVGNLSQKTQQYLRPLKDEFRTLKAEIRAVDLATSDLGDDDSFKQATAQVQRYNAAMKQLEAQVTGNSAAERELTANLKSQQQVSNTRLEIAGQQRAAAKAAERQGVASLTQGVGQAGLNPMVGFAKRSIKLGMDFDDQMSQILAVTDEEQRSPENMKALRDKAKQLGAQTAFSASDAASGLVLIAQAGYGINQQLATIQGTLDLASAGGIDIATSTDITLSAISQFGKEATDATNVADVLAMTAAKAQLGVVDLGESLKYAGPSANTFGASLEMTSAAVGVLSEAGIKASSAGTALRSMFLRLAKAPKPAAAALSQLGVSTIDQTGNLKKFDVILEEIGLSMEAQGYTDAQRVGAIKDIFGTEASAAASYLTGHVDRLRQTTAFNQEAFSDTANTAKDMATLMEDNLGGAFRNFSSALEGVYQEVYEILAPALRYLVGVGSSVLSFFIQMPKPFKLLFVGAGLLTAGLLALAVAGGTVGIAFFGIQQSIATANIAMLTMQRGLLPLTGFFQTAMAAFQGSLSINAFSLILAPLQAAGTAMLGFAAAVQTAAMAMVGAMLSPLGLTIIGISALVIGLQFLLDSTTEGGKAFSVLGLAIGSVLAPLGYAYGFIKGFATSFVGGLLKPLAGAAGPISYPFHVLSDAIEQVANTWKKFTSQGQADGAALGAALSGALLAPFQFAATRIQSIWAGTVAFLKVLLAPLINFTALIGKMLVSNLAENSPGPTYLIRQKWQDTVESILLRLILLRNGAVAIGRDIAARFGYALALVMARFDLVGLQAQAALASIQRAGRQVASGLSTSLSVASQVLFVILTPLRLTLNLIQSIASAIRQPEFANLASILGAQAIGSAAANIERLEATVHRAVDSYHQLVDTGRQLQQEFLNDPARRNEIVVQSLKDARAMVFQTSQSLRDMSDQIVKSLDIFTLLTFMISSLPLTFISAIEPISEWGRAVRGLPTAVALLLPSAVALAINAGFAQSIERSFDRFVQDSILPSIPKVLGYLGGTAGESLGNQIVASAQAAIERFRVVFGEINEIIQDVLTTVFSTLRAVFANPIAGGLSAFIVGFIRGGLISGITQGIAGALFGFDNLLIGAFINQTVKGFIALSSSGNQILGILRAIGAEFVPLLTLVTGLVRAFAALVALPLGVVVGALRPIGIAIANQISQPLKAVASTIQQVASVPIGVVVSLVKAVRRQVRPLGLMLRSIAVTTRTLMQAIIPPNLVQEMRKSFTQMLSFPLRVIKALSTMTRLVANFEKFYVQSGGFYNQGLRALTPLDTFMSKLIGGAELMGKLKIGKLAGAYIPKGSMAAGAELNLTPLMKLRFILPTYFQGISALNTALTLTSIILRTIGRDTLASVPGIGGALAMFYDLVELLRGGMSVISKQLPKLALLLANVAKNGAIALATIGYGLYKVIYFSNLAVTGFAFVVRTLASGYRVARDGEAVLKQLQMRAEELGLGKWVVGLVNALSLFQPIVQPIATVLNLFVSMVTAIKDAVLMFGLLLLGFNLFQAKGNIFKAITTSLSQVFKVILFLPKMIGQITKISDLMGRSFSEAGRESLEFQIAQNSLILGGKNAAAKLPVGGSVIAGSKASRDELQGQVDRSKSLLAFEEGLKKATIAALQKAGIQRSGRQVTPLGVKRTYSEQQIAAMQIEIAGNTARRNALLKEGAQNSGVGLFTGMAKSKQFDDLHSLLNAKSDQRKDFIDDGTINSRLVTMDINQAEINVANQTGGTIPSGGTAPQLMQNEREIVRMGFQAGRESKERITRSLVSGQVSPEMLREFVELDIDNLADRFGTREDLAKFLGKVGMGRIDTGAGGSSETIAGTFEAMRPALLEQQGAASAVLFDQFKTSQEREQLRTMMTAPKTMEGRFMSLFNREPQDVDLSSLYLESDSPATVQRRQRLLSNRTRAITRFDPVEQQDNVKLFDRYRAGGVTQEAFFRDKDSMKALIMLMKPKTQAADLDALDLTSLKNVVLSFGNEIENAYHAQKNIKTAEEKLLSRVLPNIKQDDARYTNLMNFLKTGSLADFSAQGTGDFVKLAKELRMNPESIVDPRDQSQPLSPKQQQKIADLRSRKLTEMMSANNISTTQAMFTKMQAVSTRFYSSAYQADILTKIRQGKIQDLQQRDQVALAKVLGDSSDDADALTLSLLRQMSAQQLLDQDMKESRTLTGRLRGGFTALVSPVTAMMNAFKYGAGLGAAQKAINKERQIEIKAEKQLIEQRKSGFKALMLSHFTSVDAAQDELLAKFKAAGGSEEDFAKTLEHLFEGKVDQIDSTIATLFTSTLNTDSSVLRNLDALAPPLDEVAKTRLNIFKKKILGGIQSVTTAVFKAVTGLGDGQQINLLGKAVQRFRGMAAERRSRLAEHEGGLQALIRGGDFANMKDFVSTLKKQGLSLEQIQAVINHQGGQPLTEALKDLGGEDVVKKVARALGVDSTGAAFQNFDRNFNNKAMTPYPIFLAQRFTELVQKSTKRGSELMVKGMTAIAGPSVNRLLGRNLSEMAERAGDVVNKIQQLFPGNAFLASVEYRIRNKALAIRSGFDDEANKALSRRDRMIAPITSLFKLIDDRFGAYAQALSVGIRQIPNRTKSLLTSISGALTGMVTGIKDFFGKARERSRKIRALREQIPATRADIIQGRQQQRIAQMAIQEVGASPSVVQAGTQAYDAASEQVKQAKLRRQEMRREIRSLRQGLVIRSVKAAAMGASGMFGSLAGRFPKFPKKAEMMTAEQKPVMLGGTDASSIAISNRRSRVFELRQVVPALGRIQQKAKATSLSISTYFEGAAERANVAWIRSGRAISSRSFTGMIRRAAHAGAYIASGFSRALPEPKAAVTVQSYPKNLPPDANPIASLARRAAQNATLIALNMKQVQQLRELRDRALIHLDNVAQNVSAGMSRYFQSAATRTKTAWERSTTAIFRRPFAALMRNASRVGAFIVSKLNHGAADVTAAAWDRTQASSTQNMHHMAATANQAGGQIDHSLTGAAHHVDHSLSGAANHVEERFSHLRAVAGGLGRAVKGVGKAGMAAGGFMAATGFAAQTIAMNLSSLGIIDEKTNEQVSKAMQLFEIVGAVTGLVAPFLGMIGSFMGAIFSAGSALVGVLTPVILPLLLISGGIVLLNEVAKRFFGFDFLAAGVARIMQFGGLLKLKLLEYFQSPIAQIESAWNGFIERYKPIIDKLIQPAMDVAQGLINALNHNPTERIPESWRLAVEQITGFLTGLPLVGDLVSGELIKSLDPSRVFGRLADGAKSLLGNIVSADLAASVGKQASRLIKAVVPAKPKYGNSLSSESLIRLRTDVTQPLGDAQRLAERSGNATAVDALKGFNSATFNAPMGRNFTTTDRLQQALSASPDMNFYYQKAKAEAQKMDKIRSGLFITSQGEDRTLQRQAIAGQRQQLEAQLIAEMQNLKDPAKIEAASAKYMTKFYDLSFEANRTLGARLTPDQTEMAKRLGVDPVAAAAVLNQTLDVLGEFTNGWSDRMSTLRETGDFGAILQPGFDQLRGNFEGALSDTSYFMSEMGQSLIGLDFGRMAAAVGDYAGNMASYVGSTVQALSSLTLSLAASAAFALLSMSPLALTIGGIALGVYLLATNFMNIRVILAGIIKVAYSLADAMIGTVIGIIQTVRGLLQILTGIPSAIMGDFSQIQEGARLAFLGVKEFAAALVRGLGGIFSGGIQAIGGLFDGLASSIRNEVFSGMLRSAAEFADKLQARIERLAQMISDAMLEPAKRWATLFSRITQGRQKVEAAAPSVGDVAAVVSGKKQSNLMGRLRNPFGRRTAAVIPPEQTIAAVEPSVPVSIKTAPDAAAMRAVIRPPVTAPTPAMAALSATSRPVVRLPVIDTPKDILDAPVRQPVAAASNLNQYSDALDKTEDRLGALRTQNQAIMDASNQGLSSLGTVVAAVSPQLAMPIYAVSDLMSGLGGLAQAIPAIQTAMAAKAATATAGNTAEVVSQQALFATTVQTGSAQLVLAVRTGIAAGINYVMASSNNLVAASQLFVSLASTQAGRAMLFSALQSRIAAGVNYVMASSNNLVAASQLFVALASTQAGRAMLFSAFQSRISAGINYVMASSSNLVAASQLFVSLASTQAGRAMLFAAIQARIAGLWAGGLAVANLFLAGGFGALGTAASAAWVAISGPILPILLVIGAVIGVVFLLYKAFSTNFLGLRSLFTAIGSGIARTFGAIFGGAWDSLAGFFYSVQSGVFDAINGIVAIGSAILHPFQPLIDVLHGEGGGGIKLLVLAILVPLKLVAGLLGIVFRILGAVLSLLGQGAGLILRVLLFPIELLVKAIVGVFNLLGGLASLVGSLFSAAWSLLPAPIRWMGEQLAAGAQWLFSGGANPNEQPGTVQKYAAGGLVSGPGGPTSDQIAARLSNGEFVMPTQATSRNLSLLEMMRQGHDVESILQAMPVTRPSIEMPVAMGGSGGGGNVAEAVASATFNFEINIGTISVNGGGQQAAQEFVEAMQPQLERQMRQMLQRMVEMSRPQ